MTPDQEQLLATLALAASEVRQTGEELLGDPLDVAVARHWTGLGLGDPAGAQRQVICSFAFDVERRRSGGILNHGGQRLFVTKGAFEAIRPLVATVGGRRRRRRDQETPSTRQLAESEAIMQQLAAQGLR
jgi:magnesium-transporting ATPase (P-type)